jgi:hypothetical protein
MKLYRIVISILLLAVFTTAFTVAGEIPQKPGGPNDKGIGPVGDVISITQTKNFEYASAAAYSDNIDMYLVVYEEQINNNIDVMGRFVNA